MGTSGAGWWIEVSSDRVFLDGGWYWLQPVPVAGDCGLTHHAIRVVIDTALAPDAWQRFATRWDGQGSQLCCQLRGTTTSAMVRRLEGRIAAGSMLFDVEGHRVPAMAAPNADPRIVSESRTLDARVSGSRANAADAVSASQSGRPGATHILLPAGPVAACRDDACGVREIA